MGTVFQGKGKTSSKAGLCLAYPRESKGPSVPGAEASGIGEAEPVRLNQPQEVRL